MTEVKAVDINSFHYKYYCWIRKIWACEGTKERTSLCPYCQTILWGSIFCIVLSPLLILGWLSMKGGRILSKIDHPLFDKFLGWFERTFGWMDRLDEGPERFSASPMAAGVLYTAFGVTMIGCILLSLALFGLILVILGKGVWNIKVLALGFVYGLAHLGWACTLAASWLGWGFLIIWGGVVWFFTNSELWWTIGTWAAYVFGSIIATGIISVLLCLAVREISRFQFIGNFGTYLLNKFNGFSEAKTARTERLKKASEKPKGSSWTCENCHYNNVADSRVCRECDHERKMPEPWIWTVIEGGFRIVLWPLSKCMSSYERIKSKKISIMGPFSIIWEYIIAIKKGVCPLIEFVDKNAIRLEQQAAAAERMATEQKIKESQESKDA